MRQYRRDLEGRGHNRHWGINSESLYSNHSFIMKVVALLWLLPAFVAAQSSTVTLSPWQTGDVTPDGSCGGTNKFICGGSPFEIVVRNKAGAATLRPTAVTTVFLTSELAGLPVTSPSTANVAPMARSA